MNKICPVCQDCKYYRMIDSAYGWCTSRPQTWYYARRRFLWLFSRFELQSGYPEVVWDCHACGEFVDGKRS